ncbi:MAG TPA: hypothetical protein ENN07_02030 [candidate division Zixibacteria bacterium]|nr:hypothetical protein [candidate division Zixibacteria bacterium]
MTEKTQEKLQGLIENFKTFYDELHSPDYNETLLRRDYVDPLFALLGWDINNEQGYSQAYREVIHEAKLKSDDNTKFPDYAFRIGGTRKFFVETKKPAVNIDRNPEPAHQIRRYIRSAGLPLGILTDFEEFAVYDGRYRVKKDDRASYARVMYFKFEDYPKEWDKISSIFSKDAILKGAFDNFAKKDEKKKGTTTLNADFLADMEKWRLNLATNIALRNPGISVRDLNYVVQMTIDRIIFLRICEDREIEPENQLKELLGNKEVYPKLCKIFKDADAKYNSGIFHFSNERGRDDYPDTLSLSINIDDKVLKDILKALYWPNSQYAFSVMPADILGQVYEQFLGKVIRLTAGHRAKVEDKPEVAKANGVYYTPTYIVDYIVKNTVGKLLEGKTPDEVTKLKILDPACGSGSFLIGAYQYLMDWHLEWFNNNDPEKWARGKNPRLYMAANGWLLTTAEKKRILLNNIYGVDIDRQAVEVTKLSLLLKVLENENKETIGKQLSLFKERALPDLGNNIKCGNSLIGSDFYEGKSRDMFSEDEQEKINVFDWERAFTEVFANGGFDTVIGNPPLAKMSGNSRSQSNTLIFSCSSSLNMSRLLPS